MNVHVVCCNDSVEFAVLNDEKRAQEKLTQMKDAHFNRNRANFRDRDEYETKCNWHIHTVSGE